MKKLKTYEIINSTCRRVQRRVRVKAKDMADAIKRDRPRRLREGVWKYEVRKIEI